MAFLALVLSIFVAYIATTTVYNLLFHPLAKTPGPFLCRISVLPSFLHACKGDRHVWIWQNFQIYGDTFRAAPNLVLFNTPGAFNDIYASRGNTTRSSFYRAWKRNERDVTIFNSTEPAAHAKRRRILNLAFTEQSLKASGPLMTAHIDRWIEILIEEATETWSSPRNVAMHTDELVFDILGDLCFGEKLNTKDPGENKWKLVPRLSMKAIRFGYLLSKTSFFDVFLFLQPRGLNKLLQRIRRAELKTWNNFVDNSVDKRIAAHEAGMESGQLDMFHFLLNAIDPETNRPAYPQRDHLVAEARALVVAGTDTSANTLSGLFFHLAHNPPVLAKLTAEIRSTFVSVEDIMLGPKLSRCQYLRACVDEALRISPPVPGELPREVLPGGAKINGRFYAQGTVVGCSPWSMGRNEDVYGDCHLYRPERWTSTPEDENFGDTARASNLKKQFYPFLIGSGDCAGRNIAMLELLLVCARTVWKTDMRLAPGFDNGEGKPEFEWGQRDPKQYITKDAFLCMKDGPVLQFKARSDF